MNRLPTKAGDNTPTSTGGGGLWQLRQEMDRLFDRFLGDFSRWGGWDDEQAWMPTLDIAESDDHVTVRMEIPGVEPDQLDVSLSGRQLTVSGTKEERRSAEDGGYQHCESFFGSFQRTIPLPESVDPDTIDAEHSQGVLTIKLQKKQIAPAKRVEVKTGESG